MSGAQFTAGQSVPVSDDAPGGAGLIEIVNINRSASVVTLRRQGQDQTLRRRLVYRDGIEAVVVWTDPDVVITAAPAATQDQAPVDDGVETEDTVVVPFGQPKRRAHKQPKRRDLTAERPSRGRCSEPLRIMMSRDEHTLLKDLAKADQRSMAGYVRQLIVAEGRRLGFLPPH